MNSAGNKTRFRDGDRIIVKEFARNGYARDGSFHDNLSTEKLRVGEVMTVRWSCSDPFDPEYQLVELEENQGLFISSAFALHTTGEE